MSVSLDKKPRVCMIVQQPDVKGGIAAVTNGYYGSSLENDYTIRYVESYCDGSKFTKLKKALKAYLEFNRVLKTFKPQLVHMHTSFGPSFYRLQPFLYMAKKRGIPVVDHCHGADFDTFYINASTKKQAKIRKVFNSFDKMIVLSEEWKKRFESFVPAENIEIIENYCKLQPLQEVVAAAGARFSNRQVLFLGELGQRKGGFDFGSIVKELSDKVPGVKFVFCGDGSPEDVSKIKDLILEKNPEINLSAELPTDAKNAAKTTVFFPGWVRGHEKDRILKNSSIFLLPSYQEGLPMSILDAMAYGLPIVSTNVGGIPELIHSGESGFICEPGDAGSMASGLEALLTDKEFYEKACSESYMIARGKYSFEAHLSKLTAVYDEVLNKNK